MARKRTPSPEQQKSDRTIAAGVLYILAELRLRNPGDVNLTMAEEMAKRYLNAPIVTPKKRGTKKPTADVSTLIAEHHPV